MVIQESVVVHHPLLNHLNLLQFSFAHTEKQTEKDKLQLAQNKRCERWEDFQTYCPELDKVLQNRGGDVDAVQHGVRQEEHEKLIVGESNTVINPEREQIKIMHSKPHAPTHKPLTVSFKTRLMYSFRKRSEDTYHGQWWSIFRTHLQK